MIFSLKTLSFELGPLLLEGWAALGARFILALIPLALGFAARFWLHKTLFPRLLERSWRFSATPTLLRSLEKPIEQAASYTGLFLALHSLPWGGIAAGLPRVLTIIYQISVIFCIGEGFYHASELTGLLLASCGEEVRNNRTLKALLDKIYKVVVVVLTGASIAQTSGLPIGSVVASAGLVGLTISLAAQDVAKNFFSGVVIILDRPFSVGDWIKVGDVEGEVVDINFRSTKVRAMDKSLYILTNSTISSATINNITLRDRRLYRFTLGVTYDTTRPKLEQLMADLTEMLRQSPHTYADTAFVKLAGFGDSSINLMVSAYVRTNRYDTYMQMQNDLNLSVMDVMQKDGVEFAFPSTTVYLAK